MDVPPPPATLAIDDVSKNEGRNGTTNFTFTVTRNGSTSGTATVNYATANGTAVAGTDYNATSGTLIFAPGVVTQTITVGVKGDRTAEPNETFFVNLSNIVGGELTDAQGLGTIVNDDGAALMAAFAERGSASGTTLADVQQALPLAVALWSARTPVTMPTDLRLELDDLPSGHLGQAFEHTITLDTNANGAGWYTDRTAPLAGRVDLLTVLSHEIGHMLGFDHSGDSHDLMAATLVTGARRLPSLPTYSTVSLVELDGIMARWQHPLENVDAGPLAFESSRVDALDETVLVATAEPIPVGPPDVDRYFARWYLADRDGETDPTDDTSDDLLVVDLNLPREE